MAGSFGSLQTALSAIRYNQTALGVANNNIANAGTAGYARRTIVGEAIGGPQQPAMWSRYDGYGDGVKVGDVRRMVDPLLDNRIRNEHATLGALVARRTVLDRVEVGIGEPGKNGVAAAIDAFAQSWQDLASNPGGDAARQQVLGNAAGLAQALKGQVQNVANEEADQRVHVLNVVDEVNRLASDLAGLNRTIFTTEQDGTDVGVLRDQRDQVVLRLAELVGGVTSVGGNGMFSVTVNGSDLVAGVTASAVTITGGVNPDGTANATPLGFAIGGTAVTGTPSGELGGVVDVLTVTLPAYRAGLDQIAKNLADAVNLQHAAGFDAAGNPGGAFFSYDPTSPASSLAVAVPDISGIAAASIAGPSLDGNNADLLSSVGTAAPDYQRLVNGFGSQVAALDRQVANQGALTDSLDQAWEQQAGVNLDEETVNMLSAQRAYEAAARLLTTLDQVLDTLINRTGVVGR